MRQARLFLIAVAIAAGVCLAVLGVLFLRAARQAPLHSPEAVRTPPPGERPAAERPPSDRGAHANSQPGLNEPEEGSDQEPAQHADGYYLSGQVLSPESLPLKGVEIEGPGYGRTGAEGYFLIEIPRAGECTIVALHDDYAPAFYGPVDVGPRTKAGRIIIAFQDGGRIAGTVTDGYGHAIGNAIVCFDWQALPRGLNEEFCWRLFVKRLRAVSRPDGTFESGVLAPGEYTVAVMPISDELHASEPVQARVEVGETTTGIDLTLAGGCSISGRVLNLDQNPVPQADILCDMSSNDIVRSGRSDTDGSFVLRALAGVSAHLVASRDGFREHDTYLDVPAEDVVLTLHPAPRIVGRVVDKLTGEPVQQFRVRFVSTGHESSFGGGSDEDRTSFEDREGHFVLCVGDAGYHTIYVGADGYAPATLKGVRALDVGEPEEVLVELVRGTTLTFAVTSAKDGSPVAGAKIDTDFQRPTHLLIEGVETDSDGIAVIQDVPSGTHEVVVSHDDFAGVHITVEVGEGETEKTVPVALPAKHLVRGRVVSKADGTPISGVTVDPGGSECLGFDGDYFEPATTDSAGAFEVGPVSDCYCYLSFSCEGLACREVGVSLPQDPANELCIEMSPSGSVVGTVRLVTGEPAARVEVVARLCGRDYSLVTGEPAAGEDIVALLCGGDRGSRSVQCTEDGDYAFTDLIPGEYAVRPSDGACRQATVLVRPGEKTRQDFTFGGATLFGTVLKGGEPLCQTNVELEAESGALDSSLHAVVYGMTDETGSYRIETLPPGPYRLTVTTGGLGFEASVLARREVTIGEQDVELNIEVGGDRVAGTVVLNNGWPGAGTDVVLVPEPPGADRFREIVDACRQATALATCNDNGAFELNCLVPGRYLLVASREGFALSTLPIQKEEQKDLTDLHFTLEPEADVLAELRVQDGKPPTECALWICDASGRLVGFRNDLYVSDTGRLRVTGLPPGDFALVADVKGYALARQEITVAETGQTAVAFNLTSGSALAVSVGDPAGNRPLGVSVCLEPPGHASYAACFVVRRGLRTLDENSTATFEHLAEGDYTLRVRCEGYEDASAPVHIAGKDEAVTVTLKPRAD